MLLKLLVGVLKMVHHIGLLLIHGIKIGGIKDSLRLEEVIINVVFKDKWLQDYQNFNDLFIKYYHLINILLFLLNLYIFWMDK